MKQKYSKEELLSTAPVRVAITKMGIPAILAMIVNALYNMVDTAYIGMLGNNNALAAASVAFPIFMLVLAFGQLLGIGAATTVGRQLGAKQMEKANQTASTTVIVSFIIGIVFAVLGLVFINPIFKIFGASNEVMPYAVSYGKWLFLAAIVEVPNQVFNSVARAETAVKVSAISLVLGAVTNIILDPIFMFTFGLGVEGAAIATALAQCVNFAFITSYFLRRKSLLDLRVKYFKPSMQWLRTIFASGVPTFISQILISVTITVTNILAGAMFRGDDIIAAYGVVLKVVVIGQYVIFGFMQGYQPIAAYTYGAKSKQRFVDSYNFTQRTCFIISIVTTIIYVLLGSKLIGLFSNDPYIIDVGTKFLIAFALTFVFMAYIIQLTVLYQAIGMGKEGILVSSLRQGIIYLPVIFILAKMFGVFGLILTQPIADLISYGICIMSKKKLFKKLETFFA